MNNASSRNDAIYQLDGKVPVGKAVPFGLQHILAMFVGNIAPIIIVAGACKLDKTQTAMLIQSAMVVAGLGTLIQLYPIWRIGSGLPIVMGISFTFVSIACFIGATYGYSALVGAVLIGGLIEGVLGLCAKYWLKIITPIISACVVTAIGFSLLGVGAASFGGGFGVPNFGSATNWILGTITLLTCIIFNILAKPNSLLLAYWTTLKIVIAVYISQNSMWMLSLWQQYFVQIFIAIRIVTINSICSSDNFSLIKVHRHILFRKNTRSRIKILMVNQRYLFTR